MEAESEQAAGRKEGCRGRWDMRLTRSDAEKRGNEGGGKWSRNVFKTR